MWSGAKKLLYSYVSPVDADSPMGGNLSPPATPPPYTSDKTVVPPEFAPAMATQALSTTFDAEVRPLIDLIDRLRGFGLDRDISLPAVAVIGDQSAGKSSVLEAISGVQLPRGTGIVTRCPLEMRLKHADEGQPWQGRISYTDRNGKVKQEMIHEQESVGALVRRAQNEMTDHVKGISDDLITLEVTSSDVPDLTLIDLPGIARNAAEGQPFDIEFKIKSLIRKYIQRQETIILAVLQCNVDIATCEALKMAKEFDNQGARTLGVLTKPDLLDKGAESGVLQILHNVDFPLSKGYIMVKCRGQEAVSNGQSLKDALEIETEFFRNHRHFSTLRPNQWGISNLSKRLSRELKKHIKLLLPDLKEDVRKKLLDTEVKLHELGADPPETPAEKRQMALMMVTEFMTVLGNITKGQRCEDRKYPDRINKLYSDARRSFSELYENACRNQPDRKSTRLRRELEQKMQESRGREFCNYMGKFELVEGVSKEYIKKMERPAIRCFDDIHDKTTEVLKILVATCFMKFPDFAERAKEVIHKVRTETQTNGRDEIERYLSMEDLIYSQDKTYAGELKLVEDEKKNEEQEKRRQYEKAGVIHLNIPVSNDDVNGVDKTMTSLISYYLVAVRRLCDVVPMIIQHHIFREQVDEIRNRLMEIASDERMMEHIEEDADMSSMRSECKARHQRLQRAERELDKI